MGIRAGWILLFLLVPALADDWAAKLSDVDPAVRLRAAEALAGQGASTAVPQLAECLIDDDPRLRATAARALGRAGPSARSALGGLTRLFEDSDPKVRTEARIAVARVDVDAFAEHARRDRTILALLGPGEDDLLLLLFRNDSWHLRMWVARHKRLRKDLTDAWIEALASAAKKDPAGAVRLWALAALARQKEARVVPHLRSRLGDRDDRLRAVALSGIARQEALDDESARAVRGLLGDPVAQIRARAAFALRRRAGSAPALDPLLDDPEPRVRGAAAAALGHLGVWRKKAAPHLVDSLLRRGVKPRYEFTIRSRNLRAGGGWSPVVIRFPYTDAVATRALLAFEGQALPALASALEGTTGSVDRQVLVDALGRLGAASVPVLRRSLESADPDVRRRAACNLAALGHAKAAAIDILVGCLEDEGEKPIYTGPAASLDWPETAMPLLSKLGDRAAPFLEARSKTVPAPPGEEMERIKALLKRIRGE